MDAYRSLPDIKLAERLADNDKAALEEVYLRYWGGLFNHASRLLRDEAAAEDLVHDLFAHLIDNMDTLNINTPLDAYLYKAVRNRVINIFHKNKTRQKHIDSLTHLADQGEFVTDELILVRDMKRRIDEAVASFPPKMREAFEMSRVNNLSRREIAEATGTTESTVNNQINKALRILRTRLSSWFL